MYNYRVVEAFSGIGSQVQALKNIKMKHEVVGTVEWDINALCAYDIMHNESFDISCYDDYSKKDMIDKLKKYSLSSNGKSPMSENALKRYSVEALKRIYLSIQRNNNFVSIKDVNGIDLPPKIDILTYSFPCQDLSICGFWHGNKSGIDRQACNRSGLLWDIERILIEMKESYIELPRFLLMENVSNILSDTHKKNFEEWKNHLKSMGYYNHVYKLNARNFGIPQNRERVFMLSVMLEEKDIGLVDDYFFRNNLTKADYLKPLIKKRKLSEFLRLDYNIKKYDVEARLSQPNFTPSRVKIYNDSKKISDGNKMLADFVTTITTKQDRNPNSGLILFDNDGVKNGKAPYRNLTGRECILLMGFEESQFEKLEINNFKVDRINKFFTNQKFIKMAGNSIVVQVLERIFEQVREIDKLLESNEFLCREVI